METIRNADVGLPSQNSWQDRVRSKVVAIRPIISEKVESMKPKMRELRRNPAVIAGVSGAAGLALGLAGRWMRRRKHAPTLMIVEV